MTLDTFTETPTVQHQALAASYLGSQGPSAIPETVQQHSLDAVVTSCSGNGKSRKRRISECLTVLFCCYPPYEGYIIFGRKARCTSRRIWRPTPFLKRVWRYEKLVLQANSCCFRDVRNPRGQLFLLIKGFKVIWTCCRWSE